MPSRLSKTILTNAKNVSNDEQSLGYAKYSPTPLTQPAVSGSGANESTLSETTDDYGTSYYFRGNVKNNYVNFAEMCWRIVRIEGDNTTKLLLEDRNAECNSSSYTGNWSDGTKVKFGYDSDGKADFLNFSNGIADSLKSFQTLLERKISNSYTNKIMSDYLKADNWCFDHNVTESSTYMQFYGAYTRISKDKKPSLICTGTKLTKYKDNSDIYVGTLTADEIVFAGASSSTNYLMNSYAKNNNLSWWSLSPLNYETQDNLDYMFFLDSSGDYSNYNLVNDEDNIRPAVTINPSIEISTGDGTISNPYIIS